MFATVLQVSEHTKEEFIPAVVFFGIKDAIAKLGRRLDKEPIIVEFQRQRDKLNQFAAERQILPNCLSEPSQFDAAVSFLRQRDMKWMEAFARPRLLEFIIGTWFGPIIRTLDQRKYERDGENGAAKDQATLKHSTFASS